MGPVEECSGAEELADAPEAIEMPAILWHVARCTCAEDLVGAAEEFGGGAEEFAMRTLTVKHLAYAQASLPSISSA